MNMRNLVPWSQRREPALAPRDANAGSLPESPFLTLHREMNRLFDDVFQGFGVPATTAGWGRGGPSLEVEDAGHEYRVTAELPGLGKDDIEITYDDGVLTLRGERREERRDEARSFSERWYGRFERRIALPDADEDRASAEFRDGLLHVTLPKTERAAEKTRRIPIGQGAKTAH